MNCKDFNKNLIEYIEFESSGIANHEMKQHIETCEECCALYKEKLELKSSFSKLFNDRSKDFTPQNNEILSNLDNKYYKKSLASKIAYHLKRNKFIYATGITFAALAIFALPLMKNYASTQHIIGKATSDKETTTKASSLANNNIIKYDINNENFQGKLLVIKNPKKITMGLGLEGSSVNKTTSEIAKSYGAVAAINGGATLIDAGDMDVHAGIVIHDGKIIYNDFKEENTPYNTIGFNEDGLLIVGEHTVAQLKELHIKEGLVLNKSPNSYGKALIANGKAITSNLTDRNPRTAIGQKADGSVLLLVTNGRSEKSIGSTLQEMQNIFLNYGAINAVNLVGGSHSSMYYNGTAIIKTANEHPEPSIIMVMP